MKTLEHQRIHDDIFILKPMITELKIENYKSIQNLTLEVGRVNVLIGENGCGKSNILEAITFAAAAEANKLDNEFLASRGIRVTEPQLMRSLFDKINYDREIKVGIKTILPEDFLCDYILRNDNHIYSKWLCERTLQTAIENNEFANKQLKSIEESVASLNKESVPFLEKELLLLNEIKESLNQLKPEIDKIKSIRNVIDRFVIYSPENTTLRNLEKEGQIQPLGIYGEGLFKLLTVIKNKANQSQNFTELDDIQETLALFGWFENIEIPDDYSQLEKKITIQDRYLGMPFDQRSANEGFLLVLFYITLVVSKYTPKIFAIDNLDTSLNPKLCTKLIKELARLAKKYDKQMFVTTHNPAILDGIDLGDEEQRLFVVSRNDDGHTCCDRITLKDKPKSSTRAKISRVFKNNEDGELFSKQDILNKFDDSEEPLKLSEALLRGYLGGLPEGF